ncbi:TrbG/VirB9 family P-type conjugative transfer protein [Variovorax saccharolyticus]|uniref:TrbG/VirB9 family P-type conjugative transfer protein n=1 Tax=Variovorax saccharolyticus TaxID=3053516 RepID=UPI002575DC04|nr:TrbG/VirB9 family P-type conjugative transfer protein [Variovorax sp. J31P216]MDM0029130.1 TrbG/VirB9 family P-type conjugative transfer protein [Variovorax sp. J31P216]
MKDFLVGSACLAGALLCALASADARADSRISTENYNASRVYRVFAQEGRATLIQLEEDETLAVSPASVLGIGDAAAWNLGVRGNNVVLKPTAKAPDTNIVLVTNKRTYAFDLKTVSRGDEPTYVMRFFYPDTEAARQSAQAQRAQLTAAAKAEPVEINTDYLWRGDNPLLKPTAAWDDGRFTRLVYDHAGELPVFFKVLPDGSEALLNTNIDPAAKNTVVLHEVIRTVRARLGNEVIEVINHSYKLPKFNTNGAGDPGTVRVEKGAKS